MTGSANRAAVRVRPAYHCPRPGHRKDRNPAVYGERPRRIGVETDGVLKSAGSLAPAPGPPRPVRPPRTGRPAAASAPLPPRWVTLVPIGTTWKNVRPRTSGISLPSASRRRVGAMSAVPSPSVALTTRALAEDQGLPLPRGLMTGRAWPGSIFVSMRNFWNRTTTLRGGDPLAVGRVDLGLAVDRAAVAGPGLAVVGYQVMTLVWYGMRIVWLGRAGPASGDGSTNVRPAELGRPSAGRAELA